jgi:hypothetical protein
MMAAASGREARLGQRIADATRVSQPGLRGIPDGGVYLERRDMDAARGNPVCPSPAHAQRATWVGVSGFAVGFPLAFPLPLAGPLVDGLPRRTSVQWTQAVQAVFAVQPSWRNWSVNAFSSAWFAERPGSHQVPDAPHPG